MMTATKAPTMTAAILVLGAGAISAQGMKNDVTPGAPAAQQNAPPEKIAPAAKSDQIKAPEKTQSDSNQQTTDKGVPAGDAAKVSSDTDHSTDVKSKRTARHFGARYAGGHRGPLYDRLVTASVFEDRPTSRFPLFI
jgi:hypothetical protein